MKRCLAFAMLLAFAVATQPRALPEGEPQIIIGPNILASRDGNIAHCETTIVANPINPHNLLGASIVLIRPNGGPADKPCVSFDGGATWTGITLPAELKYGEGDPQAGFGISGTAYFVALSPRGMLFFRFQMAHERALGLNGLAG